jgi:Ca2+:H+ antiporter
MGLSVLLIITYGLGLVFELKTHRELFTGADHAGSRESEWPLVLALGTLAGVTVLRVQRLGEGRPGGLLG